MSPSLIKILGTDPFTVNTSNAVLYADATFASTNQPLTSAATNTFTAIAKDSYGRMDTNTVSLYIPSSARYIYDLNGNLLNEYSVSGGTNRVFLYDDENQLTSVYVTNVWRSDFVYDGKLRRRIERDYQWNGSSWTQTNEIHFVYDGNVVIQERDANNLPKVTYTRGKDLSGKLQGAGGIGGLLARTDNSQLIVGNSLAHAFYHADGNGNVTMLINSYQAIVAKYLYDPFGNTLSLSGSLASANTYRFSSKEWNDNAGLYYYLYRFYDPMLQRWLNRDPIQEQGGMNLYGYVANDPINKNDLFGLTPPTVGGAWSMLNYLIVGDLGANIQLSSGLIQQAQQFLSPLLINQLEIILHNRILKCCNSGSTGIPLSGNSQTPIEDASGIFGFANTGNWQVRATAHCNWQCGKSQNNDNCSCACTVNCMIDVYLSKIYTFESEYNPYNTELSGVRYIFYPISLLGQLALHGNPNPAYFVSAHFQVPYSSSTLKPRCH
jgi:RHS repeat-associated protein